MFLCTIFALDRKSFVIHSDYLCAGHKCNIRFGKFSEECDLIDKENIFSALRKHFHYGYLFAHLRSHFQSSVQTGRTAAADNNLFSFQKRRIAVHIQN